MKQDRRALVLPETRGHPFKDWEIRESVRAHGCLEPVVFHRGELIDGRRVLYQCQVLRVAVRRLHIDDRIEAARYLWRKHPRRAYQMFAPPGRPRIETLAHLFGCPASEIPTKEQVRDALRRRQAVKPEEARLPAINVPREELERAHRAAAARGITLTAAIRGLVRYLSQEGGG